MSRDITLINERYRIITESLNYAVPRNPIILMYDFFGLSFAASQPSDPTIPDQMGRTSSFFTKSTAKEDITYALDKLVKYLKPHLLEMCFNSICSELTHIIQKSICIVPITNKIIKSFYNEVYRAVDYSVAQIGTADDIEYDNIAYETLHDDGIEIGIAAAKAVMREFSITSYDFVKLAYNVFADVEKWDHGFGGAAWAEGCAGYLKLYEATSLRNIIVYIDHIYDLEHNNGSLLDKNIEYDQLAITTALDIKYNSGMNIVSRYMSSDGRKLLRASLKFTDSNREN